MFEAYFHKSTLQSIIKEILDTNALISLKLNNHGNIEFNADYQNKVDFLNSDAV